MHATEKIRSGLFCMAWTHVLLSCPTALGTRMAHSGLDQIQVSSFGYFVYLRRFICDICSVEICRSLFSLLNPAKCP